MEEEEVTICVGRCRLSGHFLVQDWFPTHLASVITSSSLSVYLAHPLPRIQHILQNKTKTASGFY